MRKKMCVGFISFERVVTLKFRWSSASLTTCRTWEWNLFRTHEHLNRAARKIEMLSQLVLEETFVRILDVLWQVAEECKCRELRRELCHLLDFHELAFPHRWRIILDFRKHRLHELGCGDPSGVVLPYMLYLIQNIEDSLLLEH